MKPLTLFLLLSAALAVFAFFNWRTRLRELKTAEPEEEPECEAEESQEARKQRLGPDYKTGSGKPEPALPLCEPPDGYLGVRIDPEGTVEEVDAALARADQLVFENVPLGGSRFGGLPDLPPNRPWPVLDGKKLPFLAQIDLSVLPKSLLPAEGWLFVFGLANGDLPISVFHHAGPRSELVRAARPAEGEVLQDWDCQSVYDTVPLRPAGGGWENEAGQLFGDFADDEGGAADIADIAEQSGDDWITLLAISSCGSMMWSDCGWLHLVIRRQDLEKHDFSRVCSGLSLVG